MAFVFGTAATATAADGFEYCAVVCRAGVAWPDMMRAVSERLPGPRAWSGVWWKAAFLTADDFLASVGVPVSPTVAELAAEVAGGPVPWPVTVYVVRRPGADL